MAERSLVEDITLEVFNAAWRRGVPLAGKHFWKADFEQMAKLLPQKSLILDAGCGMGTDYRMIVGAGLRYVGIDISLEGIKQAQKLNPAGDFLEIAFADLAYEGASFPKDYFDGLWVIDSLTHVPKAKLEGILRGLSRVSKKNSPGVFVMRAGAGEGLMEDELGVLFTAYYSGSDFAGILERNKFSVNGTRLERRCEDKNSRGYLVYHVKNVK